jgi:hypothetical protein
MTFDAKDAFEEFVNSDGEVRFDMYAQDIDAWSFLRELIPGIVVSSAGGAGLFQAEGLLNEYPFYFRSETGTASICIATPDGSPHLFTGDTLWFGRCDTDGDIFFMSDEDFVRELMKCMKDLKVAPFLWEFRGKDVEYHDNHNLEAGWTILDKAKEFYGYGQTAEEGYAKASEPFTDKRFLAIMDIPTQKRLWQEQEVNPNPVNQDKRVFPAVAPEFLKLSRNLS